MSVGLILFALTASAGAAEYRAEPIKGPAPSDDVSPAIAKLLAPAGYRVIKGTSRVVCEFWLCKQWKVGSASPTGEVNFPFRRGQLVGIVHYPRKGGDFRDQPIDSGTYTLRYEQQPIDGDHVGTSPTRDFLLVIAASEDKKPDDMKYDVMTERSAEAVETSHPGMLALKPLDGDGKPGSIRTMEDGDWVLLRLQGEALVERKSKPLAFDLVVVGYAPE